ncbi:MAG: serine/threonine protein kinase [Myxococcales bacterium]|nr:serine/threonine protein kinase [Myxococcales bacterium]
MAEALRVLRGQRAGTIVAGRYRLVERIGEGAVGAVWRATHLDLGTHVALKLIHDDLEGDDIRARFVREARLAARLGGTCRYIARVMDYGQSDEVGPFLVMELLEGETLADRLRREGHLPLLLVVRIVAQLARALSVAHAAAVVHRDLKPANVFLTKPDDGSLDVHVKLMDFGIAKLLDEDPTSSRELETRRGSIVGTPAYMSPEQALAQAVDERSDLWSLGATVYRLLTGQLPFGTANLPEIGFRIVGQPAKPPSAHVPELPAAIDAWMEKALAKTPDDRFADALEMAEAFAVAAGVDPAAAMPTAFHPSPMPSSGVRARALVESEILPTRRYPALERTASGLRKRRTTHAWHLVVLALVVLVAALVVSQLVR